MTDKPSNDETVVTPEFRVSYPRLFKPEINKKDGKAYYSLCALFPKGADLSALKALAAKAARKKWGDNIPAKLRSPLRDQGEKVRDDHTLPAGHEAGAFFFNTKSLYKPGVVDQNVQPILDETDVYGGCYGRAQVTAYGYDVDGNKGVAFGLQNFQKTRDGDSFGRERISAEQAFQAVAGTGAVASSPGGIFD